ncbi:MAG: 30S ribosomal protein S16 [Lentisphaerae bacterium GWF2_57_35]|nr:MAG: 30S ribosomal protein S16 [Lentisphaerae bacterium GWF2_57_35]
MAVKIRLRRMGSNKKPFFRIVAADARCANGGAFLEQLGWYDPKKSKNNVELNLERVDYWVSKGAQVTDTVRNIVKRQRKVVVAVQPSAPAEVAPAQA